MAKAERKVEPYTDNVGHGYVARATLRNGRIAPRKVRLVLDQIRGLPVDPALQILRHSPKKGARIVLKVLQSAVANAREQSDSDVDSLWVGGAWADMGRTLHRYMPRAHGRATGIRKRSSHITICLTEK